MRQVFFEICKTYFDGAKVIHHKKNPWNGQNRPSVTRNHYIHISPKLIKRSLLLQLNGWLIQTRISLLAIKSNSTMNCTRSSNGPGRCVRLLYFVFGLLFWRRPYEMRRCVVHFFCVVFFFATFSCVVERHCRYLLDDKTNCLVECVALVRFFFDQTVKVICLTVENRVHTFSWVYLDAMTCKNRANTTWWLEKWNGSVFTRNGAFDKKNQWKVW